MAFDSVSCDNLQDSWILSPAFSQWAEDARKREKDMKFLNSKLQFLKPGIFSWIILVAGLVCLALGLTKYEISAYCHELGVAFIIAWGLAFTVDSYFKRGLLRDAFEAVFGYVLPDYFREELNRISKEVFVAEETRIIFDIERVSGTELVKTKWTVNRKFKNITNKPQQYKLFLDLDNFGFPGFSPAVQECSLKLDQQSDFTWLQGEKPKDISINPHQKFEVFQQGYEIHRENGASFWIGFQPSTDPEITINAPDDIEVKHPQFLHPHNTVQTVQKNRYKLEGTFMPYQPVIVRWIPKNTI